MDLMNAIKYDPTERSAERPGVFFGDEFCGDCQAQHEEGSAQANQKMLRINRREEVA